MEATLTHISVGLSEFKKNPAAALRKANNRPVAVLDRDRTVLFYAAEPHLFEAMLEELAEQNLRRKVASRLAGKARAIEVDIDQL